MSLALIVEDHPLFRDALAQLARAVLGEPPLLADSAEAGLRLLSAAAQDMASLPAVIVLDLNLPGLRGVAAIAAFRTAVPGVPVLVVSGSDDPADRTAAEAAGARYVAKTAPTDILADALRQASDSPCQPATRLTPRQREILILLCQGLSNKEIGRRLDLADPTVKMHMSSVLRALGVASRTQAVLVAKGLGLDSLT
jgi:DNA-binding NarL/FixJ family response regulator